MSWDLSKIYQTYPRISKFIYQTYPYAYVDLPRISKHIPKQNHQKSNELEQARRWLKSCDSNRSERRRLRSRSDSCRKCLGENPSKKTGKRINSGAIPNSLTVNCVSFRFSQHGREKFFTARPGKLRQENTSISALEPSAPIIPSVPGRIICTGIFSTLRNLARNLVLKLHRIASKLVWAKDPIAKCCKCCKNISES